VPDCGWAFYPDNRAFISAFVVSAQAEEIARQWTPSNRSEEISRRLNEEDGVQKKKGVLPWTDPASLWISFLNADSSNTDSAEFQLDLTARRTYRRWAHKDTLYGFSHHSCACMVGENTGEVPVGKHFGGMYYDQLLVLLYLRCVVYRFSQNLSTLSAEAMQSHPDSGRNERNDSFRRKFMEFRRNFDLFSNLYQFPLFSNQQQALEMYEIARRELDVDQLFDEVNLEVKSTEQYFSGLHADLLAKFSVRVGVIAAVYTLFAIVFTFAGIRLPDKLNAAWDSAFFPLVGVVLILMVAPIIIALKWNGQAIRNLIFFRVSDDES